MRTYDDSFSGQRIYPGKVRPFVLHNLEETPLAMVSLPLSHDGDAREYKAREGTCGIRGSQLIEGRADTTARDWVFEIGCYWLKQSKANAMIQTTG